MKLSLSTRIAEAPKPRTDLALIALDDFCRIARDAGFSAICMRASQLGIHSTAAQLKAARKTLDDAGLRVASVIGDSDVPANNERAGMALRQIGRHLDVAQALGADLIRIGMKARTDIPWAQRAADEAAERGIRLAHQCHTCTLFETVDLSLQVLREVGRENFGLIFDPANLAACGQDYGEKTLRTFAPHLFSVYLQNRRHHPGGKATVETWINGPQHCDILPFGDPLGIDFKPVFEVLSDLGFDGYATVHQVNTDVDVATGVRQVAGYLRSIGRFS